MSSKDRAFKTLNCHSFLIDVSEELRMGKIEFSILGKKLILYTFDNFSVTVGIE